MTGKLSGTRIQTIQSPADFAIFLSQRSLQICPFAKAFVGAKVSESVEAKHRPVVSNTNSCGAQVSATLDHTHLSRKLFRRESVEVFS